MVHFSLHQPRLWGPRRPGVYLQWEAGLWVITAHPSERGQAHHWCVHVCVRERKRGKREEEGGEKQIDFIAIKFVCKYIDVYIYI